MKKLVILLAMIATVATASAQFEAGKQYVATSFEGLGLSYSEATKTQLNVGANYGYFIDTDWMLLGEAGFNYSNSDLQKLYLGAAVRYYIEQNGLFLQGGAKYVHSAGGYNDLCITPELGYCYFLNRHLTVEPAVYYNISLSNFSDQSEFGVKIGLGFYF